MKVLFVCSGNVKGFDVVPFIKEQGDSLERLGVKVHYFPVKGKGPGGYLKASLKLRSYLKENHFDLIHAHFILSGCTAVLAAGRTPVVLSLMGSDAYGNYVGENRALLSSRYLTLLTLLIQPFVKAIISKASNIERYVYMKRKSYIIPNGIDTSKFKPSAVDYSSELALNPKKKKVLFLGSKNNVRKNLTLVQNAISYLDLKDIEIVNPYPVPHDAIPKYLNSVNVLVVSSYMEGSPNVVKEAMSCNCPIVATDVGDVRWVLGETDGCYIASFKPEDYAAKLREALKFSETLGRTQGQQRIRELGLDSENVARRVVEIYKTVLRKNANTD